MPNARIVGTLAATPTSGLPGSLSVQDILDIIHANAAATAATAKAAGWTPPPGSHPNQQAFPTAPVWTKGAQYWKTGTKPQNEQ
jgi:hypothetical protein